MNKTLLLQLADGNPGAITCLVGMYDGSLEGAKATMVVLPFVEEHNIIGTDLYVFWSDLCDRNYDKMIQLVEQVPASLLKDACSRQDRSGKNLLKAYL